MRRLLFLMFAVLGCGTTSLSAKGRQVALLDADPGSGCATLGTVAGSADPFFGGLKPAEELVESARNDARNVAAKMGATHVKFTGTPQRWASGTFGGGEGVTVSGVAYRCESPAAAEIAPVPTGFGCTMDTDCKGDRICESRICVDPKRADAP
jgi:Domain of unknown function (DUF4156)